MRIKVKDEEEPENSTEWETVKLDEFGPIAEIDLDRNWNSISVVQISSPPPGRERHRKDSSNTAETKENNQEKVTEKAASNKHNLSLSSNEENSSKKRKPSVVKKTGKLHCSKETPIERFLRKKKQRFLLGKR